MYDAVESRYRERYCQQSQAPGYSGIVPSRDVRCKRLENIVGTAALPKGSENNNERHEQSNVQDPADYLKRVEKLSKPEIEQKGQDEGTNHDETSMPPLWRIVIIVENG